MNIVHVVVSPTMSYPGLVLGPSPAWVPVSNDFPRVQVAVGACVRRVEELGYRTRIDRHGEPECSSSPWQDPGSLCARRRTRMEHGGPIGSERSKRFDPRSRPGQ